MIATGFTIGTSLLGDMIAEHLENAESINIIYPQSCIYSYGIAFTLLLALFILPSLVYLNYVKKKYLPEKEDKPCDTTWWHIGKESIDDIKLIFAIILPLVSSLVQHFI